MRKLQVNAGISAHTVHVDAVGVRPAVLVRFHQSVCQRFGYVMKTNELFNTGLLLMLFLCALVQPQHYG